MATLTLEEYKKRFRKLPRQIEFSGVVALTRTAALIQKEIRRQIEKKFTLRRRWALTGIKIERATMQKKQAEVFTLDWFMPGQDSGERRRLTGRNRTPQREFWIPGRDFKKKTGIDPDKKVIPKSWRVPKIMKKQFIIDNATTKSKGKARPYRITTKTGTDLILVRDSIDSGPSSVLYIGTKKPVKIKGRKFFEEPSEDVYQKELERQYDIAFEQFVTRKLLI